MTSGYERNGVHAPIRAESGLRRARELSYHPELDGVRALAVLAVMVFHVWPYVGGFDYLGGFLGVDVFFVLSGYLITTLLYREFSARGRISFGSFYARRALRLLPALFLTLIFAWFVYAQLEKPVGPRSYGSSALLALSYVGNWAQVRATLGVLAHTWSLAIEEQYYLVWPLVMVVSLRLIRSARSIAGLLVLGAVGIAVIRYLVFFGGNPAAAALTTVTRTDGVILGSALALILADPPDAVRRLLARPWVPVVTGGALLAASLVFRWNSPALFRGGLLAVNLCAAMLIGHMVVRPQALATRLMSVQPLPAIGRISYGLYLFHIPVNYLVHGHPATRTGWRWVAASFGLSFLLAGASFLLVERRALRLKRRFGSMSQMPEAVSA